MRSIAVALIICSSLAFISCKQEITEAPVGLQLDLRIPPVDQDKYKSVLDASNWANPYLVIQQDGIEVIAKNMTPNHKLISASKLQKTLMGLPVAAWPYGKVVVVQENGVRGDKPGLQKQNLNETEQILKSMKVKIERWPSA